METRGKVPIVVLIVTLLSLMLLPSLLVTTSRQRSPWRVFPKDTAHWFGWFGAVLLGVSASYSALKRRFPKSIKLWLTVHCIPSILSLIITGVHLTNRVGSVRPSHFLSFLTFGLMILLVLEGIGRRYVKIKILRAYGRILHTPLAAIFYITLGLHILIKTGIV